MLNYFNQNASVGYYNYDSPKMSNGSASMPEISSRVDGQSLAINGIKQVFDGQEIDLNFMSLKAEMSNFRLLCNELLNIDEYLKLYLVDRQTGAELLLVKNVAYHFQSGETNDVICFALMFKTPTATNVELEAVPTVQVLDNTKALINLRNTDYNRADISDVSGRILSSHRLSEMQTLVPMHNVGGVYFVKLMNDKGQMQTFKVILH